MKKGSALLIAVAIAALCAFRVAKCRHREAPSNIEGLADALKRSAEKDLTAPHLANEQIILTAAREELQNRARQVVDAAIQAGGTAIESDNSDGTSTVLAQIPSRNEGLFRGLIQRGHDVKQSTTPGGETQLIEVTLKPQ